MSDESVMRRSLIEAGIAAARERTRELDSERLRRYIECQADVHGAVQIEQVDYLFGGGASNSIAFVSAELDRGRGRESLDMVVRYASGVPLIRTKTFEEEFLTLRAVSALGIPAPRSLWLDADGSHLGFPNFVMERLYGINVSPQSPPDRLLPDATPEQSKAMFLEAAGFHGALRNRALGPADVPHLLKRGHGATDIERELSWWHRELKAVAHEEDPKFQYCDRLYRWLVENQPRRIRPGTLVHGDSQVANLMFRDGEVVAALDWEFSYLGHGETDLTFLAALATGKMTGMEVAVPSPTEAELIERYEAAAGGPVQYWEYFKLFFQMKGGPVTISSITAPGSDPHLVDIVWAEFEDATDEIWHEARRATRT